ncbi:hypothetical protein RchiOBHm_Chr5g0034281 [Rosa chinensis]|uniref:RING-type E3 ubiquitin transferase n=3 Tax=Rosa chinensis TaxID=74649 RepID=A0A2P6QAX9_ROSCH|nr:hypothetical protein RchiOBHm_Chr5g0034281 [Rosa chinensis]
MAIFMKIFIFFFVFVTRSLNSVSSSTSDAQVYFADHCASIAPPHYSTPQRYAGLNSSVHRLTGFYYSAGETNILSQNSIVFRFRNDGAADEQGLFMVQGSLRFPSDSTYNLVGNSTRSWQSTDLRVPYGQRPRSFRLNGVWSESSGELCMVGSGSNSSDQGNLLTFPVVLKLHKLKSSSSLTSLISGTLESLVTSKNEPNYFGPISISLLPSMNYQYTFVSNKSHNSYSDGSVVPPSSLKIGRFCRVFSRAILFRELQLRYSSHCGSANNCSPLAVSDLPRIMSLNNIECLEDRKTLRVLVDFAASSISYQRPFNPTTTLVAEGSWDARKNQLNVVACRFVHARNSFSPSHVGDCSTRLTMGFPSIWTIGNSSCIVGKIWSNKSVTEAGYFENITFDSAQSDSAVFPGQRYEYTKIDKATKLCPRKKTDADDKNNIYPNPFSYYMGLDITANSSTGEVGWGYSVPLSVDNKFFQPYWYSLEDGTEEYLGAPVSAPVSDRNNNSNRYNISYRISIKAVDGVRLPSGVSQLNSLYEMGIFAEGIYDGRDGSLCMVGCRYLSSNSHQQPTYDSVDCEIVVNVQFPPTNPNSTYSGFIKGSIESTREMSDPLHFEGLDLTSAAGNMVEASQSIWRMDVEIILVVISNTLACVFGALQLFHVKRNPDVLPSISILMLYILALGYMIPLMLNFDALFTQHGSQTVFLGSGWLELNEVIVRVVTMVGFLLQIRLLQITMSAKSANGNQKELWAVEKLALFVALPVYVGGSLVALLLMNWRRNDIAVMVSSGQKHPILGTILKSCAGLFLDAFLFPQILLNMFSKSTEKALSVSFFVGTTLVRVLPHAYDLYRAHTSGHQLKDSYIYASPAADFYSTAWNVIIPFGGLLFAVIIYLQQRFGGCCILPQKFLELGEYEKVPIVTEAS